MINKICVRGFRPSVDSRPKRFQNRKTTCPLSLFNSLCTEVFRTLFGYTVIRFVSAKFGSCTGMSVNGTLVKAKLCTFTLECTLPLFNKCPIYTHDGASAKLSTNQPETGLQCVPPNARKLRKFWALTEKIHLLTSTFLSKC
jgi:hypothetical protein